MTTSRPDIPHPLSRRWRVDALPWPTDWSAIFESMRPLVIEIGFGNGNYLLHLAESRPDFNIVGFEISNQSLEKAERKISHARRHNAAVVYGRGESALHHLFTPGSLREVHVNYPDPWFKTRHAGRRLIQRDTLDAITSRLEPGGYFYLATDIRDYAEMAHALLQNTPGLTNTLASPWGDTMPGRITTKYEEKGYREGRPGHFFVYQRNDQPAPYVPVMEEWEMPHAVIHTPLSADEILERFEKLTHHAPGDVHAAYVEAYLDHRRRMLLFEVKLQEPTIDQHFCLALAPRDDGDYTLRYATIGSPRPTPGMHQATAFLADWIAALHPEGRVVAKKLREG